MASRFLRGLRGQFAGSIGAGRDRVPAPTSAGPVSTVATSSPERAAGLAEVRAALHLPDDEPVVLTTSTGPGLPKDGKLTAGPWTSRGWKDTETDAYDDRRGRFTYHLQTGTAVHADAKDRPTPAYRLVVTVNGKEFVSVWSAGACAWDDLVDAARAACHERAIPTPVFV